MNPRKSDYPVLDIIIDRWSPRAMSGETISTLELMSLFEAARWAPSSYNHQPWRFIYAERNTPDWDVFFSTITPGNQVWAQHAAVLILAISHKYFEYNNKYSRTHTLDTGAATENLALQGHAMGLVVHGMEGFDYDKIRTLLAIPEEYDVEAMYAVGKPGPLNALPQELQKRETPSSRLKVQDIIFKGRWRQKPAG